MVTNFVTVGSFNFTNIKNYNVKDSGMRVERKEFVMDSAIYAYSRGRSPYKTITISGQMVVADAISLDTIYKAGASVSVVDLYGFTHTACLISSFGYNYIRSSLVCDCSIEIQSPDATSGLLYVGSTKKYGIETFTITDGGYKASTLHGIDGNTQWLYKTKSSDMLDITISGIEAIPTGDDPFYDDDFTTGVYTITAPNGVQYACMTASKSFSYLEGTSGFRKFRVQLLASTNTDKTALSDEASTSVLYEALSLTDKSARISEHLTFSGKVIQNFGNSDDFVWNVSYIISKANYNGDNDPFTTGELFDGTICGEVIYGVTLNKSKQALTDSDLLWKVSVSITSVLNGA